MDNLSKSYGIVVETETSTAFDSAKEPTNTKELLANLEAQQPRVIRSIFIFCMILLGCSPSQPSSQANADDANRMAEVLQKAVDEATNPLHRKLLEQGEVFVDLEDLEVPCVGVRVPLPNSDNRAFLSFTKTWFHEHRDEEIVSSLLVDLSRIVADQENKSSPQSD